MAEIKGTDIAWNGLTYDELGKIFYYHQRLTRFKTWETSFYQNAIFTGLQAVFSAIQKEQEAQQAENVDPGETKLDQEEEVAYRERKMKD